MNISNNVASLQVNQTSLNQTAKSIQSQNGDLSKDIPNLMVAENINAVNVTAIKTQDEMFGSLLDIKG